MIWRGYLQYPIRKLVLPGDIKARQKQPHVVELAKSIADSAGDPIHAPTINVDTMEVVAGRDRMAALLLNGAKKVWCHVAAEVSPQDFIDLEVDENLHRRQDNRDLLIARKVANRRESLERDASKLDTLTSNAGRKKSAKGAAREQVARELGTTTEAVRAAERRAAEDEPGDPSDSIDQAAELAPPVETWGIDVSHLAQEFADVRVAQAAFDEADRAMRKAQAALSGLKDGSRLQQRLHAAVYTFIHNAADHLRSYRPTVICPYCKALPHLRDNCSGCTFGFSQAPAEGTIDEQLLARGADACVAVNGKVVSIAKATAPKAKAPKTKALRIEDEDGNPIDVAKVDPPSLPLPGVVVGEEPF